MSSYISEQILTTDLSLYPHELRTDVDDLIHRKLKDKVEGVCSSDGYVLKDSIQIIRRHIGKIQTKNNQSHIQYKINYRAKVISPNKDDIIDVFINNINKMGVVGYIKIDDQGDSETSPMIVIIPREYFENSNYNINDIHIHQQLSARIIDSRIKYNSDKIQAIASPV